MIAGTESHNALMLAKGNDGLRNALDEALGALREDGSAAQMHRVWFGDEGVQLEPARRMEER